VIVEGSKITSIKKLPTVNSKQQTENYILPGFIDSHVHIESSISYLQRLQSWPLYMVLLPPSAIRMKLQMYVEWKV